MEVKLEREREKERDRNRKLKRATFYPCRSEVETNVMTHFTLHRPCSLKADGASLLVSWPHESTVSTHPVRKPPI
jgi:hypothetical protein